MKVGFAQGRKRWNSFTLVELLTVIFIIAILAALTLTAGEGVMKTASRNRAKSEIQAMSAALESYKVDNGIYPPAYTIAIGSGTNSGYNSTSEDGSGPEYQASSQLLYQALSGKINFEDTPVVGNKSYMNLKANQLGNANAPAGIAGTGSTYVQDPFGYSYGYYTGDSATPQQYPPYNGTGQYDLWSTGGALKNTAAMNAAWIINWTYWNF